jgi:hypothetical protein
LNKNPGLRGYTKKNCFFQQQQKMMAAIFNCSMVYSYLPGVRYCTPVEMIDMWNPNDTMKNRQDLDDHNFIFRYIFWEM